MPGRNVRRPRGARRRSERAVEAARRQQQQAAADIRAQIREGRAEIEAGSFDQSAFDGRVRGRLAGLRTAIAGSWLAGTFRAKAKDGAAAAGMAIEAGRGAGKLAAPKPERIKAAQESVRKDLERRLESAERLAHRRARQAVHHSTPTLAEQYEMPGTYDQAAARATKASEQSVMTETARANGVQHFIHVGPVDGRNHPVSFIYLGAVRTREEWLLVSPDAFTGGLHNNERGSLEPVDPGWDTIEDPDALREAIDSGDPYRAGDYFDADQRRTLNRPLRPDEAREVDQAKRAEANRIAERKRRVLAMRQLRERVGAKRARVIAIQAGLELADATFAEFPTPESE